MTLLQFSRTDESFSLGRIDTLGLKVTLGQPLDYYFNKNQLYQKLESYSLPNTFLTTHFRGLKFRPIIPCNDYFFEKGSYKITSGPKFHVAFLFQQKLPF